MKKLLILNEHHSVVPALKKLLVGESEIDYQEYSGDLQDAASYATYLQGVDWILTALGPNDVDLDFEALFDGIDDVQPPISHFVMLSYAGVDDELPVQPSYENVKNLTEFIKQQRYAIKIVDESEIPYSIIRVPKLIDRANSKYQLFNEGEAMPNGEVSNEAVARLVLAAFKDNQLINRSVGIINA